MKRHENSHDEMLRHLGLFKSPPPQEIAAAEQRIVRRLRAEEFVADPSVVRIKRSWRAVAAIAAAAAAILVVVFLQVPRIDSLGIIEAENGMTFDVVPNEPIRTQDDGGAVLTLADGSRIEVKSQSELSLERAEDGIRIHLNRGSVIVSAAEQPTGHLYVETKDLRISVVGTVFLVNAEETGSRVAVLEGEVQVDQGATSKTLMPGEQVMTNPLLDIEPVSSEIAWSQNREALLALLQVNTPAVVAPVGPAAPSTTKFEVASVRRVPVGATPRPGNCRGVDGTVTPLGFRSLPPAGSVVPQGSCLLADELGALIAIAYDIRQERVYWGQGPERYEVEGRAADTANVTTEQLRQMLRALLEDYFKLKVHRETRQQKGFALVVADGGVRFQETSDVEEIPPGRPLEQSNDDLSRITVARGNFRMRRMAEFLSVSVGGPVIDRTNLQGLYNITLAFRRVTPVPDGFFLRRANGGGVAYDPPMAQALEEQLGLRLEPSSVPVEYLMIDQVEHPVEN